MKFKDRLALFYIRTKFRIVAVFSRKKAALLAFDLFCTPRRRSRKQSSPVFDRAERLNLTVEGMPVRVYRWNRGGSRKVVILHGFESSAKNFDRYVDPLVAKGYEVLAADAPAHGESGGERITLPQYMATIRELCAAFGPVHGFMAHSFGGLALTQFLETHKPEAGTRLALIAPATETTTAMEAFFQLLRLSKGVKSAFIAILTARAGVPPAHFSIPRAIRNIDAAVLWVHDREDDITPITDVQPVIDGHYPHVQFMITEGWGHRRIYREAAVVEAVTSFL